MKEPLEKKLFSSQMIFVTKDLIYLFIYLFIYFFVYLFIYFFVYLFIYLFLAVRKSHRETPQMDKAIHSKD